MKQRGGYSAGGRTVSELPPAPPSVSVKDARDIRLTMLVKAMQALADGYLQLSAEPALDDLCTARLTCARVAGDIGKIISACLKEDPDA